MEVTCTPERKDPQSPPPFLSAGVGHGGRARAAGDHDAALRDHGQRRAAPEGAAHRGPTGRRAEHHRVREVQLPPPRGHGRAPPGRRGDGGHAVRDGGLPLRGAAARGRLRRDVPAALLGQRRLRGHAAGGGRAVQPHHRPPVRPDGVLHLQRDHVPRVPRRGHVQGLRGRGWGCGSPARAFNSGRQNGEECSAGMALGVCYLSGAPHTHTLERGGGRHWSHFLTFWGAEVMQRAEGAAARRCSFFFFGLGSAGNDLGHGRRGAGGWKVA